MQWVFDQFIGWLLERLTSCFSVISTMLFTFFNLNRTTFDTFFSFFGTAGAKGASLFDLIRALGFALCIIIVLLRLLSNLLSSITEEYEDPIKLAFRAILGFVLVAISTQIIDMEFEFMQTPYSAVKSVMSSALKTAKGKHQTIWESFAEKLLSDMNNLNGGVIDTVVIQILTIGCLIAIFSAFLKLTLEVAERYVVICISVYLAPLAFATSASKNTVKIMQAYIRMVFCQLLLMIFNVIFVDGTLIAIYNYTNGGGIVQIGDKVKTVPSFIFCVLLMAFITAGQKMDTYMRSLGLDTVQTGSLFDEIRGGLLNAMFATKAVSGAARAAGGFGNMVSTAMGHSSPGGNTGGKGHVGGTGSPVKDGIANATRAGAANWAHSMAQGSERQQSIGRAAAQRQIKSGAFNGVFGESSGAIRAATEAAIGAAAMAKMGIDPSSLTGKNGMIDFKSMNGAKGTISFDEKKGNGWHQLKDENNNPLNAWVKGSNNLGVAAAQAGTHMNLANAFGEGAGAKIMSQVAAGGLGEKVDMKSLEAISLGNGEFALVGKETMPPGSSGQGKTMSLGRIVPAETGANIAGAIMAENEFGGQVGFIPQTDTATAMNGKFVDDGIINLGNGMAVPSDAVKDALESQMESNNIAKGTAMLGFTSDGNTFTASFADSVTGTKEISGNLSNLMDEINPGDMQSDLCGSICASRSDVMDALSDSMQAANIPDNADLTGFESIGNTFKASFAYGDDNTKEITGKMSQLLDNIGTENIHMGAASDFDSDMVGLTNGISTSSDNISNAISNNTDNLSDNARMTAFSSDGNTFTATFNDPKEGESTVSGSIKDLVENIGKDNVRYQSTNDSQWIGMNDLFDTRAYSAMTGETPKEISFNRLPEEKSEYGTNAFVVTNESGSQYILDQAGATGKYDKVIGSGDVIHNVPLSIRRMPKQNADSFGGGDYGSGWKGKSGRGGKNGSKK